MAPSKGVLVDTWYYVHQALKDCNEDSAATVEECRVAIKLRLVKRTGSAAAPPYPTESVSFVAENKEYGINIEGTDVEAIRKAVFSILDKRLKIVWERYLLVHVERPSIYDGTGSGVVVRWTDVSKGTAWDGTELLRELKLHRSSFENQFKISPWPGAFTNKQGRVIACIPATEQNEAALQAFADNLDELRKRIGEFLAPSNIHTTLLNLSSVAFLPGADGAE